jgi:hypothetical protein
MQRFTSAQWSVLRYAANHGRENRRQIGALLPDLEQRGLLSVWRCTTGCHAIRLTAAGAAALALGVPVRTRNAADGWHRADGSGAHFFAHKCDNIHRGYRGFPP